jgi:hypothetical protein
VTTVYVTWGFLAVLFVVAFLAMKAREEKTARRDESTVDRMFGGRRRPARPAHGAHARQVR